MSLAHPPAYPRSGIRLTPALLCAAALLCSPAAQAQWKWKDASGRVQMSDMPPPGAVPEKDILQKPSGVAKPGANRALTYADADTPASAPKPAGTAASAPGKKTALDLELERRKQAAEQEQSAKKKADEEHKATVQKDNCSRARSTAATFESGQRVSRMNERGEREYLDDRQRAAEAQRARDVMAANCR